MFPSLLDVTPFCAPQGARELKYFQLVAAIFNRRSNHEPLCKVSSSNHVIGFAELSSLFAGACIDDEDDHKTA